MPSLDQVMEALKKADASGNTEDAKRIAVIADKMRKLPGEKKERRADAMPFILKGAAETLGAPVDLLTGGLNLIPGVDIQKPVGGSESIKGGLRSVGLAVPEREAGNVVEHMVETTGEVAGFLLPMGGLTNLLSKGVGLTSKITSNIMQSITKHPWISMVSEVTGGIGAGAGRGFAEENVESPMAKTAIELAGGLAGGMGPTVWAHISPTALTLRSGKKILRKMTMPFTKKGSEYRAGQFLKGQVADPKKAAETVTEQTIGKLPPAIASGEERLASLHKSLIKLDPAKDADMIETLSNSIIEIEKEMRKLGYGAPELLAEVTEARIASLELKMSDRVKNAMGSAQNKLDDIPVATRKASEAKIVRDEIETLRASEHAKVQDKWKKVSDDYEVGVEKTRETFNAFKNDLAEAQQGDIPAILKKSFIIKAGVEGEEELTKTTLKEMQGLRSKLLEVERIARKDGKWNKARIAGDMADAILDDIGVAAEVAKTTDYFYAGTKDRMVEIIKNPTHKDYQALSKEIKKDFPNMPKGEATTRFTYDKEGNKYIWRADKGTHYGIEPQINDKFNTITNQNQSMLPKAEGTMTAEASNLKTALAATRAHKITFESGIVGDLLGFSKSGVPRIDPALTLEKSMGMLSEKGAVNIEKITITPEAKNAVGRYLGRSYVDYAAPKGAVNPSKSAAWIKNNEAILDQFPELRKQLTDATTAQEYADKTRTIMESRKAALRDPKISTSAKFLNIADLDKTAETILKDKNPIEMTKQLIRQAGKDPTGDALKGLKGSFVDHMLEKSSVGPFNKLGEHQLSGVEFKKILYKNKNVLKELFTPEQMKRIDAVADELYKIDSYLKISAKDANIEMSDAASVGTNLLSRIIGARLGGWMGKESAGGSLQMAQIYSGAAQKLTTRLNRDRALALIHDAILSPDPELLKTLLLPLDKPDTSIDNLVVVIKKLNTWLVGTGKRVLDDIEKDEEQ